MKATILKNREFAPLYFHLAVTFPHPSPPPSRGNTLTYLSPSEGEGKGGGFSFSPGQFAMIRFGVLDPFLPRAFSIYKASHQPSAVSRQKRQKAATGDGDQGSGVGGTTRLEFLYKVMGRGSTYLSTLKKGQTLELLAPLGRGFTVPEGLQTAILVAGGIGVPPIVALAEWIARTRDQGSGVRGWGTEEIDRPLSSNPQLPTPNPQIKMVAFIGGKLKEDVLCVRDFKKAGAEVHMVTEDGSMGQKGLVTDILDQYLLTTDHWPLTTIYACGPNAMLAAVATVAAKHGLPCQVSMEATMACGFGICMGCAIRVRSQGYRLCCKDGPVFDAEEIAW